MNHGVENTATCLLCGAEFSVTGGICSVCGRVAAGGEMANRGQGGPKVLPAGVESRPLTVMFCDLVDSTTLLFRLGSETYRELIDRHKALVHDTQKQFGGKVESFSGDGALIYFGHPVATEVDVKHAIEAGLYLIEEVGKIRPEDKLQLRVGISTGTVIVRNDSPLGSTGEHSAVGMAVNLASRLQEKTAPNTITICEATRDRAGALFNFADLGKIELKGVPDPVAAWRVLGKASQRSWFEATRLARKLSPFVGRDDELGFLKRYGEDGNRDVLFIDIVGEAGIGKSRLVHEFKKIIEPHAKVFAGNCSPDGQQTVLLPFIDVVRRTCDLSIGEDEVSVGEKLKIGLACVGMETPLNVALLLNLLGLAAPPGALEGLDRALIGLRTRDLLLQLLRVRSQMSRLILVLEDLHWMDRASVELLERIAAEPELPLLIVTTRRPTYAPPWLSRTNIVPLPLNRLAADQSKRIIQGWLGEIQQSASVVDMVVEKAEGNPLFSEEMARFVAEPPKFSSARPGGTSSDLPDSIQSLWRSRLDELSSLDQLMLQTAAVIGRRFSTDILAGLLDMPRCEERLAELEKRNLLRRSEVSGEFFFKHALLRDVLYESIRPRSRRASMHADVAAAIERRSADRLVEVAEVLAHHYGETQLAPKAVTFLGMSAVKSFGVYSLEEANQYFGRALKLIEKSPVAIDRQKTGELVAVYLQVLGLQAKYPEATAIFEKYNTELEQLDDKKPFVLALNSTCFAYFMQMQFDSARRMATRALEISEALADDRTRAYAVSALVFSQPATRALPQEKFEALAADAVERSRRADDGFIQVRLLFDLAWYYLSRGSFTEGRRCAEELMKVGKKRNDSRAIGLANWTFGLHYVCEGSYKDALDHSQKALDVSLTIWDKEGALWVKAGALALLKRKEEARAALNELTELCAASNDQVSLTSAGTFHGVVLILEGRFAAGVRCIENCIETAKAAGWRSLADWARTNLAEVYLEFLEPSQGIDPSIAFRNLAFLITLRFVAARRASNLLNDALENDWFSPLGYFRARMHFDLGRVLRISRKRTPARQHCEEAGKIASELANLRLMRDVENELAKLQS